MPKISGLVLHDFKLFALYFSHTAIEAPERCVFGQMVNIGAVMRKFSELFSLLTTHLSVPVLL